MKNFFKHVSIYGILPIVGKLSGFILLPVYTTVFSSIELGIAEVLITFISFIIYTCNLEIYTSIGKYFHDNSEKQERSKLVSSGLALTLFFTALVCLLLLVNRTSALNLLFENQKFTTEYNAALIWLFISAISTYIGVIPRYSNKQKLFVTISTIALLIRVIITLICISYYQLHILGIFIGHIFGSTFSLFANLWISQSYFTLSISKLKSIQLMRFALPIVPGVILFGLWKPLSINLISNYYSLQMVGLVSFALRVTSILEIVNSGMKNAWQPLIFENHKSPNFKKEVLEISNLVAIILLACTTTLILLSHEIVIILGSDSYSQSSIIIGFTALASSMDMLRNIRGFAPLLNKKTYIITIIECIGIGTALLFTSIFSDTLGIYGVGAIILIPPLSKYIMQTSYTMKQFDINFIKSWEIIGYVILITSLLVTGNHNKLIYRALILVASLSYFATVFFKQKKFSVHE